MEITFRIIVRGRVQGVWFRARTRDVALEAGLTGYVCNRPDGSVEIEATGNRAQIDKLIDWCRQGPPLARVDAIDIQQTELVLHDRFEIRR